MKMRPISRIFIKLIEVAACLSCVIAKAITDQEAKRTFILNQKLSREWSLIHNVTWSLAGNSFASVTYGGYTLITSLMAISRLIESRSPPTIIEKIFLTLGMLLFLIMGGLVLAAIDQVPYALIDNAIIMGLLSFLVAFLFLIDLSDPLPMRRVSQVQTNTNGTQEMGIQANDLDQSQVKNGGGGSYAANLAQNPHLQVGQRMDKDYPRQPTLPADHRRPQPTSQGRAAHPHQQRQIKQQTHRMAPDDPLPPLPPHQQQQITVHSDSFPRAQDPVLGHILTPEKMRAHKSKIPTKGAFIVDEIPKTRRYSDQHFSEDDTMSRISAHSYVKTTEIDTLPKSTSMCSAPDNSSEKNKGHHEEEVDSPIVPGYVASTAKMWDKRSKSGKPVLGSNTRV